METLRNPLPPEMFGYDSALKCRNESGHFHAHKRITHFSVMRYDEVDCRPTVLCSLGDFSLVCDVLGGRAF